MLVTTTPGLYHREGTPWESGRETVQASAYSPANAGKRLKRRFSTCGLYRLLSFPFTFVSRLSSPLSHCPFSLSLSRRPSLSFPGPCLRLFAPSQATSVCIYLARLSLGKYLRTVCSIVITTSSVCARHDDSWALPRRSCSGSLGLAWSSLESSSTVYVSLCSLPTVPCSLSTSCLYPSRHALAFPSFSKTLPSVH